MKLTSVRPNLSAWKIAGIYALSGYLWILFSDRILAGMVADAETLTTLQTYKGWFYVAITALLVQWLVKRRLAAIKQVQTILQERETRFRRLFENSPVPLIEADFSEARQRLLQVRRHDQFDLRTYFNEHPDFERKLAASVIIREVNPAAANLFRANSSELLKGIIGNVRSEGLYSLARELLCRFDSGDARHETDAELLTMSGEKLSLLVSATLTPGFESNWEKIIISLADLTIHRKAEVERARLEAQLRQAQKMESIGALAGGIAHDFNNILTPLCGYTDLALEDLPASSPVREDIEQVQKAAYRGKDLVKQILSFSRRSDQQKIVIDLKHIIKETAKLLQASLPPSIEIQTELNQSIGKVLADPTQIHQVLMNLCTNAFHAMKDSGGQLTVRLSQVSLHESSAPHLASGEYVACAVTDTGCGIPPENQERIFEPFFTTKDAGEGTGLGLSVSHGIVVSHGGTITCTSQPLVGSTFTIYLPVSVDAVQEETRLTFSNLRGSERILIVDDDSVVAEVAKQMLERQGYCVACSNSPLQALERLRTASEHFDLAIFNQAMPKMSGLTLAEKVRGFNQDMPIAMLTGFGKGLDTQFLERAHISVVIAKPFTAVEIAEGVRAALSNKPSAVTAR
ncbi:MAG: response regulator [bacterium]|nr:response regulator [bacterium]